MQKALENPHYKKIWERVMMNRHPEAKSLEESLTLESRQYGCMITMITSPLSDTHRKTEVAYILYDDGVDSVNNERWYCFKKDTIEPHTFTIVKSQAQIIGRPITFEDMFILLTGHVLATQFNSNKIFTFTSVVLGDIKNPRSFTVNFNKPLHEQDTCIWETISKLID